jgi:hypothetical protein
MCRRVFGEGRQGRKNGEKISKNTPWNSIERALKVGQANLFSNLVCFSPPLGTSGQILFSAQALCRSIQCLAAIPVLFDQGTRLRLRDPVLLSEVGNLIFLTAGNPSAVSRASLTLIISHCALH